MQNFKKQKVLFVVTEDWYFCSHRLPLALKLIEKGYDVLLATRVSVHEQRLVNLGIKVISLNKLRRSSINPIIELLAFFELYFLIREERPDILHQVALKPIIYGSIIALFLKTKFIVNAFGGMGSLFITRKTIFAEIAKFILLQFFKRLFNKPQFRVIVQNSHDYKIFQNKADINSSNLRLIPSAGVELHKFSVFKIESEVPAAILASRMLWDKGVGEFVTAAMELKSEGFKAKFILAGNPDPENPNSISERKLRNWHNTGAVEWIGFRNDIPKLFSKCWVVCLPSYYGEGVPKVLIEAMAASRPIITTTMPGCEDLISVNGQNGILVQPRDSQSLKSALKYLLSDNVRCNEMGQKGLQLVSQKYSSIKIINDTLKIYEEVCVL